MPWQPFHWLCPSCTHSCCQINAHGTHLLAPGHGFGQWHRGQGCGDGQSVQLGTSPHECWVTAVAPHPSPTPTSSSSLGPGGFLWVLCSLSALGAQCVVPGLTLLHQLPGWSFHPPRALCSALAAREKLRHSSGSHTEPGQVMLSPFHRWVAEDWRDADHKHLFILGAQLELCRAGDFTALEQALRGRCWHCRRGSSQRNAEPQEQSSWMPMGRSASPVFWKTSPHPEGEICPN